MFAVLRLGALRFHSLMPGVRHASANLVFKTPHRDAEQCVPYHCLLEQLGGLDDEVVHVTLTGAEDGHTLTRVPANFVGAVPMGHSPSCPCRYLDDSDPPDERRPLQIGVVVLLESTEPDSDCTKILLTRRKDSATLFPGQWVLPGGHVDEGEDLITAALREVKEETGICITGYGGHSESEEHTALSVNLFCLWESNYPTTYQEGPPTSHHLVPFYRVKVPWAAEDILLQLQETEVSGAAWADSSVVKAWIQAQSIHPPSPSAPPSTSPSSTLPQTAASSLLRGSFSGLRLQGHRGQQAPAPFLYEMQNEAIALGHQFCILQWATSVAMA